MEIKTSGSFNGSSFSSSDSESPTNMPKVLLAFFASFGIIAVPVFILNIPPIKDMLIEAGSSSAGLSAFLFIAYIVFFFVAMVRIFEWSVISLPKEGVDPVDSQVLLQRVSDLTHKMPVSVDLPKPNIIVYRWNYANEKFVHFFGAGKIVKSYELTLKLNPKTKEVYSSETIKEINLGVQGLTRAFAKFQFFKGISLFNIDYAKGNGFTVKDGQVVFDELYNYKFNDAELKGPIINTITLSGWKFAPKVFLLT